MTWLRLSRRRPRAFARLRWSAPPASAARTESWARAAWTGRLCWRACGGILWSVTAMPTAARGSSNVRRERCTPAPAPVSSADRHGGSGGSAVPASPGPVNAKLESQRAGTLYRVDFSRARAAGAWGVGRGSSTSSTPSAGEGCGPPVSASSLQRLPQPREPAEARAVWHKMDGAQDRRSVGGERRY
jgi:hypothetical protein